MAQKLYRAITHPDGWGGLPDYEVKGNKFYRTVTHPQGYSGLPDYEIRKSGKVYRTVTHPQGWGGLPDYEFRPSNAYSTEPRSSDKQKSQLLPTLTPNPAMQRDYRILAENVKERINPDNLLLTESFSRELSTIGYSDVLKYVRLAMKGVDAEYTRRSKEAGENARKRLEVLDDVTFNYQGSVMTNTHIRASSDIDLLALTNKYYSFDRPGISQIVQNNYAQFSYQPRQLQLLNEQISGGVYGGSPLDDLRKLRLDSERILQGAYTSCDITHAKAIKIRNKGIGRDVDVVIANYYDDATSVINNKGAYRGIEVYNKEHHRRESVDYPFLSIERINQRGIETVSRVKKMIRFLKNMKFKSEHNIFLSSFDFNAICYDINANTYKNLIFYELVPVIYRQLKSLVDNPNHANGLMSVDGREAIFKDRPDKLQNLRYVLYEVEAVYQDLRNVPRLMLS